MLCLYNRCNIQPPSGGCELKQRYGFGVLQNGGQPPSGGCELKQCPPLPRYRPQSQPPSGGCELKRMVAVIDSKLELPAAFGRL